MISTIGTGAIVACLASEMAVKPEIVETLHRTAWHKLLLFVSGKNGDGGEAYQRVHLRLEAVFRWRGLDGGRDLADRTLDRVARKLMAEEPLDVKRSEYVLAIAREIGRESKQRNGLEPDDDRGEGELRARVVEECIEALTPEERALIARRFEPRGERLMFTERVQTSRARARLERWVRARLGKARGTI